MRGAYSAAMSLSPTRIMVKNVFVHLAFSLKNILADTGKVWHNKTARWCINAQTFISGKFCWPEGKCQSCFVQPSVQQILFCKRQRLFISIQVHIFLKMFGLFCTILYFSGSRLDSGYPTFYRTLSLPSMPAALWSQSNMLFAICRNSIYKAIENGNTKKLNFKFHARLNHKVLTPFFRSVQTSVQKLTP